MFFFTFNFSFFSFFFFSFSCSAVPGCTSKHQPMDACINKTFKVILRKCWVEYVSEMTNKERVQLSHRSHQDMVDWVEKAFNYISSDTQMFIRSFHICGINTADSSKVRNGPFCKVVWKTRANTFEIMK